MCKVGDIILVKQYKSHGIDLNRHSFVVLSIDNGNIQGLPYDIVCNVMSSFHSEEHKRRKLKFPGNLEISHNDENVRNGNAKGGYIKADQFYYFSKSELDYMVIGNVSVELFIQLLELIKQLETIEDITENL